MLLSSVIAELGIPAYGLFTHLRAFHPYDPKDAGPPRGVARSARTDFDGVGREVNMRPPHA